MDSLFIWAQVFGVMGMCCSIFSMQCKNPRHIIMCYIPGGMMWGIQYLLLGAPMGALFSLCAVVKDSLLASVQKKHVYMVIFGFLTLLWIFGLYLFKNWFDILPLMAGTIMNLAWLQRDNRPLIARAAIINQICWFSYNIIVGSWLGCLCSLLVTSSAIIGMARYENWEIGKCYRSFLPSLGRSLFIKPQTFP